MTTTIEFPLSEPLQEQGITRIAKEGATIVVNYIGRPIRFQIQKNWDSAIKSFKKQAEEVIRDKLTIQAVETAINDNYLQIIEKINEEGGDEEDEDVRIYPVMKYTENGILYEAVRLGGGTCFVSYHNGKLNIAGSIEGYESKITPFVENEPTPYEFADMEELAEYLELAKKETKDTLYKKTKVSCTELLRHR